MMKLTVLWALWLYGLVPHQAVAENSEMVFPRMLEYREDTNERSMEVTAFGKTMNFRLQSSPVLGPNLVVRTDDGPEWVYTKEKLDEMNRKLYQDTERQSSLYIDDSDGPLHVEGMLTEELRIEPVPNLMSRSGEMVHRVTLMAREEDTSEEAAVNEIYTRSPFHNDQRYPPANISVDQIVDYDPEYEAEQARQFKRRTGTGTGTAVNEEMNVELLIIADKAHSSRFTTETEHVKYLALSVNGINLRYGSVPKPKIKVDITGILRSTNDNTEPYVVKNTYKQKYLLDANCLDSIGVYIEKTYPSYTYDVALLYTGKDLADMDTGKLETNVAGIAWVGAACVKNYRFGLSEDEPKTFNGVRACAHEIAHLLGSPHDGDPSPGSMPGSRGATKCPWKDGFIMSYVRAGEKSHRFSQCSSDQFAFYRQMSKGACLRKRDGQVVASSPDLPASMYPLQKICDSTYPEESGITVGEDRARLEKCQFLCCRSTLGRCSVEDAVDGMACAPGKKCMAGRCE